MTSMVYMPQRESLPPEVKRWFLFGSARHIEKRTIHHKSVFFLCSTSLDLRAGGMTSHAAVVARGMGRPCVAGAGGITVDYAAAKLTVGSVTVTEGQILTIDGSTGEVMVGEVPTVLWRCKRLEQTWGPTWCTQAAGTTTR